MVGGRIADARARNEARENYVKQALEAALAYNLRQALTKLRYLFASHSALMAIHFPSGLAMTKVLQRVDALIIRAGVTACLMTPPYASPYCDEWRY